MKNVKIFIFLICCFLAVINCGSKEPAEEDPDPLPHVEFTQPKPPRNFIILDGQKDYNHLVWINPTENIDNTTLTNLNSIQIYRQKMDNIETDFSLIKEFPKTFNEYKDYQVDKNFEYKYYLIAVAANNEKSSPSTVIRTRIYVDKTQEVTHAATVENFVVSDSGLNYVLLRWDKPNEYYFEKYRVIVAETTEIEHDDNGANFQDITNIDTINANFTDLESNTTYYAIIYLITTNSDVSRAVISFKTKSMPIATFTSSTLIGNLSTEFIFTATLSDDNTNPYKFMWDFNNDGVFDSELSTNNIIMKTFESAGVKKITLKVIDSNGLETLFDKTITIVEGDATSILNIDLNFETDVSSELSINLEDLF